MLFDKPLNSLIFDHMWILFILVTFLNAINIKIGANRIVRMRPELRHGYDQLIKGYLVFMNIPWVVMGIGMVFGGVPSSLSFSAPRHGNSFVLAFHVTLGLLWALCVWWIYFNHGAEFLSTYHGVFRQPYSSPLQIKFIFGFSLLGVIVGTIAMWIR